MVDLNSIKIFRMTHIENIPHILENGITHSNSPKSNPTYMPIGDGTLISTRSTKEIPDGRLLGNFIPFYFGVRTPMLYVMQKGFNSVSRKRAEDIVYLVSSVQNIMDCNLDFVFTDGHAVDGLTEFYKPSQIGRIEQIVDFNAAFAEFWSGTPDTDLKRRKEAEFLVEGDLPLECIRGFVVYNETAMEKLLAMGIHERKVKIKKNFYF
jgi:hypothetical protein